MEKQQVQLNRMVFVDEIPEEVERIFRKSATLLSSMDEPLMELTNLLEQKNHNLFLHKLKEFREQLARADLLFEDCNGITKSYVQISNQEHTDHPNQHQQAHNHQTPMGMDGQDVDIQELIKSMQEQTQRAQDLKNSLGGEE
jgi:hypothetical protein